MSGLWQRYASWFGALQPRERLILGVATLFGILFVGYMYGIDPAIQRTRTAVRATETTRLTLVALESSARELAAKAADPDAPLRAEMGRLDESLREQAKRFQVVEQNTIPAQSIPRLLETLVGRTPGLQLQSLRTLEAQPLIVHDQASDKQDGSAAATPTITETNIYRHEVEITIAGPYLGLLDYLVRLESEAPNLGWHQLRLDVAAYPQSVLTLSVQTLSLDSAWLAL